MRPPAGSPFVKGDRVRFSREALAYLRTRMPADRVGTIVGFGHDKNPRVWWEGTKTSSARGYHPSYLVRVEERTTHADDGI
jgi:hypothetical protein